MMEVDGYILTRSFSTKSNPEAPGPGMVVIPKGLQPSAVKIAANTLSNHQYPDNPMELRCKGGSVSLLMGLNESNYLPNHWPGTSTLGRSTTSLS